MELIKWTSLHVAFTVSHSRNLAATMPQPSNIQHPDPTITLDKSRAIRGVSLVKIDAGVFDLEMTSHDIG